MNWWDVVRGATDAFLVSHGVLAAFVYLAIEEAGVPIPIPGDFLMLTLGVRARDGGIVLWQVIAAMEAGTVLGSTLLYLVARRGGRAVVERYGRFVGITPRRLDQAAAQLNRHGAVAVVLGRLLPGLRVVTAIACGVFGVPFPVFFPAMALGGLVYIVAYTMLGYFAGPAVFGLIEALHLPVAMIGTGVPLLLLVGMLIVIRRGLPHPIPRPYLEAWHRARVGFLAGSLATVGSLLTLDLVVAITGDLAWRLPNSAFSDEIGELSRALARDATGGLLWLVLPLITGVGWGAVYAVWAEPRLPGPDAVRGVLFALVPFLVGSVLLAPVLTQMRNALQLAPVALLTEAARQLCFGLIVGLGYPVLRARHRPDSRKAPASDEQHAALMT